MQILVAAGYQFVGNQFPRNWEEKLLQTNPRGFYESELRKGIYFETNPHPETGHYLPPQQTRKLLVKVFIPGLVKSDVAFLDKVVATIRPWRDVVRSIRKFRAIEADVFGWENAKKKIPAFSPPEVEWLQQNFFLIRDLRIRGYPAHVVNHGHFLSDPHTTIRSILEFLDGPVEKAETLAKQVEPGLHRNRNTQEVETIFNDEIIGLIDIWTEHLQAGKWDDDTGLQALNEAWKIMLDQDWLKLKLRWDDRRIRGKYDKPPAPVE